MPAGQIHQALEPGGGHSSRLMGGFEHVHVADSQPFGDRHETLRPLRPLQQLLDAEPGRPGLAIDIRPILGQVGHPGVVFETHSRTPWSHPEDISPRFRYTPTTAFSVSNALPGSM